MGEVFIVYHPSHRMDSNTSFPARILGIFTTSKEAVPFVEEYAKNNGFEKDEWDRYFRDTDTDEDPIPTEMYIKIVPLNSSLLDEHIWL
jgi:hypothetical protein